MRYKDCYFRCVSRWRVFGGFFLSGRNVNRVWSQFFLVYMAISLGFIRMRAELGLLLQGIHYSGPLQLIVAVVGSRRLSRST